MTSSTKTPYAGHRFPPELISYTVWLYFRFPLSLRMVEEMLAFRGIEVSHETIRQWGLKFGQEFANIIRRRLHRPGDKWHLNEVVLKIRPDQQPLPPAPPPHACNRLPRRAHPRRAHPRLSGVARRLWPQASRIVRSIPVHRQARPILGSLPPNS